MAEGQDAGSRGGRGEDRRGTKENGQYSIVEREWEERPSLPLAERALQIESFTAEQ